MNVQQANLPNAKQQPGMDYYVRHYFSLFWRWKWYIGFMTPIVFCGWIIVASKYGNTIPEMECVTTLQFEQGGSADDQAVNMQRSSCSAIISSRPFLQNIAENLSLQLFVEKKFRSYIFDSISIEKDAPVGKYDFIINKDEYTLYYSNQKRGIQSRVVIAGKLFELNSLSFPSVSLQLTSDFISDPYDFSCSIVSQRQAIDWIVKNLSVKFPNDDRQSASVMFVLLKGRDYPLIAEIANAIADNFVAQTANTRQSKKSDVSHIFEKQLQEAKSNLAGAEEMLRRFREANPTVGAANIMGSSLTEVSGLENSVATLKRSIDEAVTLQTRCSANASLEDQLTAFYEAITFLSTKQSVAAPALQVELNEVSAEKRRVDADYAPQHPLVIENRKKIARLAGNVSNALSDVIEKMRSEATSANIRLRTLSEESRKLPAKEVQLLSLERKRATMAEMYSDMQMRYNANKMTETSKTGNVFVVDRAVAPIPPGRLKTMSKLLIIGVILSLVLGVGPAAGLDYFDKRARNEDDCKRFSNIPFLEGIPVREGVSKKADKEKLDEKLVTSGFEPGLYDEMYRSLRTKILLHLHEEKNKLLVVTSLNVGDGKSLLASNLGIIMAQQKLKTLLIDGDMRKGVQHHSFVLEKKPGLSDILSSPDELTTLPINSLIQTTHVPNLSLLSCGIPIPNPAECMNSQKFRDLSSILAEWFEVIILDTPPLRVAVDAAILPEAFKHYIIVARVAKTNIAAIDKKIDEFPGLRKKILGIVLNGVPINRRMKSYRYSYYHH